MKRGSELVAVDPQLTWIASKARHWLRLRPGTDAALALGMLNVIIEEDLVRPRLHRQVDVRLRGAGGARGGLPAGEGGRDLLDRRGRPGREAARFYAKAHPSTIQWGLAVDMSKIGTQTAHAIACLAGVTGNIDNPGGNILIDQASGLEFSYNSGIETPRRA